MEKDKQIQMQPSNLPNKALMELVAANGMTKVKDCTESEIKAVLAYIFVLLGTKSDNIPNGMAKTVILDYIFKRLPDITIEDLRLAFVLAVEKKINVNLSLYGETFSAKILSDVKIGRASCRERVSSPV